MSEKELDQQARDFMTFPPKIHNEKTNKSNNSGRTEQGGCGFREDHISN